MIGRLVPVDAERARRLAEELLGAVGMERTVAATVVSVQITADERGMHSHGLRAIPMYADRIRLGIINPRPKVRIEETSAVGVVVHGDDGPGQYVATLAANACVERARHTGVALAVARRSNHLGAVGYYANLVANAGFIGFATTNGNVMLPHAGSNVPFVGNNPLAWSFPAGVEPPLAFDVATSVVSGGKVDLAAAEGVAIPSGWGVDREGQSTEVASDAAASGLAVPLGAPAAPHKGLGLALVLEALAGVLSGARFGRQHAQEVESGSLPWDEGHFFMAIDPAVVMPRRDFVSRMDSLINDSRSAGHEGSGRVPGADAHRRQVAARHSGLLLPASVVLGLNEAAIAASLAPELMLDSGD